MIRRLYFCSLPPIRATTLGRNIAKKPLFKQATFLRPQHTAAAMIAMGSIGEDERTYPLKKPKSHKPPVPRWSLRFDDPGISHLHTLYIGVQCHNSNIQARTKAENHIASLLPSGLTMDTFRVTHGFDNIDSKVWVCYFTDEKAYTSLLKKLNLSHIWSSSLSSSKDIGLWLETFTAPLSRLETNYSRLDHKPGLAQLPGTTQSAHELTAYWGAGRDRIPASAHDQFPTPKNISVPKEIPTGFGERLTGTNYDHMCHIRSGQWWEKCPPEEREAYEGEGKLQEKLMGGMQYLWDHPLETGTIGLRFLQNTSLDETLLRETCGAGFFRNWGDLEKWSSRHPSHLAIFNGAMAHAKRFGEERKFMTWHEVWIFKAGEVKVEYVNCDPGTGMIKHVDLEREKLAV